MSEPTNLLLPAGPRKVIISVSTAIFTSDEARDLSRQIAQMADQADALSPIALPTSPLTVRHS